MRHNFKTEQWLPYPLEQVFAFFGNPDNLPRLMPDWQAARIERSAIVPPPPAPSGTPLGKIAGAGTRMTITFRPFPLSPLRVRWDAEITEFVWNDHFCDVQHRGPFAYWRHCHSLRPETREGTLGTLLQDQLDYELPFGSLGELARKLVIPSQLRATFEFRQKRTAQLMAAPTR